MVVAPTDNEFKPTPKFKNSGTSVPKKLESELRQTTVPRQFVSPEISPHKQQNKDKTDLADESMMSNDSVDLLTNTDSDTGAENQTAGLICCPLKIWLNIMVKQTNQKWIA
ncbi:uncharacterized protein LOC129731843 [Wyeomyia smithii]|uniref:uncharacterized protein LOC129731843 n=1 Tax=Wyeomyia smithii TaxID=174621 RepID=UPI0024680828|nr:uncharacterized protein LOC129731843 [Wyeomyia smithii]